jgi:hypothetical protein
MYALQLDDYQLHSLTIDLPCKVKSIAGLGFPDVRLDQYARAGTHGVTIAHNLYGGRLITLEGTIRGATPSAYLANRQALQAAVGLKLDSNNVPETRTLYLTDLAGTPYRVEVVTKSFQADYASPGLTWGRWQLQLQASDYIIESGTESSVTMTLPVSGGVTFPLTFPITFGASSGGSATATNAGNAAVYPTVTISGPVVNPVLTNDATGESLRLNITLLAGDTLVVNTRRRTILLGQTNKMSSKIAGSTFWSLPPGDNPLRFAGDTYNTGTATIIYRPAWLGL